jgi:hypothetical protein
MEVNHQSQNWRDRQKDLYDKINKKAIEFGIFDRKDLNSYYRPFDIVDMYRIPNELGKVCKEDFRL